MQTRRHSCVAHGRTPAGPQVPAQDVRLASRLAMVPFCWVAARPPLGLYDEGRAFLAHTVGGCFERQRRASLFVAHM
jgi:hypothetical protein